MKSKKLKYDSFEASEEVIKISPKIKISLSKNKTYKVNNKLNAVSIIRTISDLNFEVLRMDIRQLCIHFENFPQTIDFFRLGFKLPPRRTLYQHFHLPIITFALNLLNLLQNNHIIGNLPTINITINDLEFTVSVLGEDEFRAWVIDFEFDRGLLDGHILSGNEVDETFFDFRGDTGVLAVVVVSVGFFWGFLDLWDGVGALRVWGRGLWRWWGEYRWSWVLFL